MSEEKCETASSDIQYVVYYWLSAYIYWPLFYLSICLLFVIIYLHRVTKVKYVSTSGYRGWGCTDSLEAIPNWELLLATLLLTLSNLFFLPAIILALKRRYFAEAIVYAFTMVFSTVIYCDVMGRD